MRTKPAGIDWGQPEHQVAYLGVRDLTPGMRVVGLFEEDGSHFTIKHIRFLGEHQLGGSIERQRYGLISCTGKLLPLSGDSKTHVMPPLA